MRCSICTNEIIITKNETEYIEIKNAFENKVSQMIDDLSQTEFEQMVNTIWNILLNYEGLLLRANQTPYKCSVQQCHSLICIFCYRSQRKCKSCNNCTSSTESYT